MYLVSYRNVYVYLFFNKYKKNVFFAIGKNSFLLKVTLRLGFHIFQYKVLLFCLGS